jgi:hypothetical protein
VAKGLDLLLNKIRTQPAPTLVSRYLALVGDIADQREKANHVLKLATVLTKTQPDEALRLAHQVYKLDPHLLGALEVMAEAFRAKGRFAKAAVIQLEMEKLERRKAPEPLAKGGPAVPIVPIGYEERVADLLGADLEFDLSKQVSLSSDVGESAVLGSPLDGGKEKVEQKAEELARGPGVQEFRLTAVDEGEMFLLPVSDPKPTMIGDPSGQGKPVLAGTSEQGPPRKASTQLPDHGSLTPPGGLSRRLLRRLMGKEPGDTVLPFPPAASAKTLDELGVEAQEQASPKRPAETSGPNPLAKPMTPSQSAAPIAKAPPLWQALGEQLARLRANLPLRHLDAQASGRIKSLFATHPSGASLPETFVHALGELDHRLKGSDAVEILAIKWELFQGLWGAAPTGACADLLKTLGLRHATPPFWGLYLDGLLADRRFHAALHDMRVTLKKHPHLNWARIVAPRLPIVWQGLKVHGFDWSEDDGVAALIGALAARPKPKLSALIVYAINPKKAGL